MKRLIYSSSPIPTTHYLKPFPSLPRPAQFDNVKLGFSSSSRPETKRVKLFCCKHEDHPFSSSPSTNSSGFSTSRVEPLTVSAQKIDLVKPITIGAHGSGNQKTIISGTVIAFSALIAILIPVLAPPAFASFQTAAKAASSAAATVGGRFFGAEILNSAWTGFFAGCLHTLSGPDHLAALAPLSIGRTRLESAAVGALWGCGHDAGQVIFGLLFLLLKDQLHIEILRTWGTRIVALTLIAIGVIGIKEASVVPAPCVALENGDCDISVYETLDTPKAVRKKVGFTTFATGIVHGLQPDALVMLLPALALPSRLAGAAFLVMFLVGTVASMGSYTVFIGSCSLALKERIPRITEKLSWASSFIAIALGLFILISQFLGLNLY